MKNVFPPFSKLVAVVACALSLGSCNRAEYALLPKGSSYHGVSRAATPVPAAPAPVSESVPAGTPATAPVQPAANATPPAAPAPVTPARRHALTSTTPTHQPTALQRLALRQVTRKVDKLVQKSTTARAHDNTASTTKGGISGNLRTGIILLLIGLLVGILNSFVGTIIAIIGLIFIVLWLLDQV